MGFVGVRQVTQYIAAEVSRITRDPLTPQQIADRLDACRSCSERVEPPNPETQVGFCRACRCPHWSRSELTIKAAMPAATCPLKRWK